MSFLLLALTDLFIGTQGLGNVTPAAAYPFGLVQPGPDTSVAREQFLPNKGHCGGYQHDDRWIWRFSQTHISGTGCPSFGDFGIMPYAGDWNPEKTALAMDKRTERAAPGYYAVGVENGLGVTRCEMTALAHTAVYRFTFGRGAKGAKLLVDLDWNMSRHDITNSWRRVIRDCRFERRGDTFLGGRYAWAWNDYRYHFALKVSAPVVGMTTLREPGNDRGGIYALELGDVPDGVLTVRIALSNTSPEAAERNLLAEAPEADFDAARKASAAAWQKRLGAIELDRATDPNVRTSFETAMYRLHFQPNRQSDVGARPTYSTFSLWDTFRAAHPLYTILAPAEDRDFVLSMLDQYDRQGYLPIWALGGSENHCMIGHHAVPVVVDAYLKGLLSKEEGERAFRAVRDSLTRNHKNVNDGTWGLMKEDWDILDRYGYYPFDRMRGEFEGKKVQGESVARVYECAYDDACAARLAEALGHAEDAAFFKKRSGNWRNVFDASIGYARGKDSQGRWREPFNRYDCGKGPWFDNDFCEGGSCQYTWHVMQDPEGLVAALGGKAKAGARLDLLFNDKAPDKNDRGFNYDIAGCIGQYVHGNEPSHHIAYLYAYTDRPENVGPIIRKIFDTKYGTTPDGLCGNDDCGQMSAWYVFSALGFYPVDPCGGTYVLGAPQVPGARVRLPNGKVFAVVAKGLSKDNACVKSVTLNGKPVTDRVIRHADILAGGELVFEMGEKTVTASLPCDGTIYDAYLKTKPGKERKAFLSEAFGGAQFDMRDILEMVAGTPESAWDVRKAAQLDRLVRRGLGRTGGPDSECGRRVIALRERVVEPIKKRHNLIVDGVHAYSDDGYIEPKDPAVRAALEKFRDRKLGLMMHFGIYSQLGIVESWPLVDKEAGWSRRLVDWQPDGEAFKREYWSLIRSFNPVRFQPEVWAETARRNGFRYLVFTTKHHDGFCLFDSKYSDFKVTSPACPFSKHPQADIVKATFDAFRAKGMTISCYFSKPDWHHPDYWDNGGLGRTVDRMPTYDVEEEPERWARFREFVRNQLLELTRDYGPLDQLWLDGGQVQKHQGLDIRIEEIVAEARKIQPGLIAVDRATRNSCENIVTPEQTVPPVPLAVPWESCITMGTGFSYRYDDTYKSPRELVHLLIDIVAKGGNLALNVAPGPDGRLPKPAIERMDALGDWLARNGRAIYGTRVLAPYRVGDWAFTKGKNGERYAIRLWKENERGVRTLALPETFEGKVGSVVRLATGATSSVVVREGKRTFDLAADDRADALADAFELKE